MEDPLEWLCAHSHPGVRCRALSRLADAEPGPALLRQVWELGDVRKMFAHQNAQGVWEPSQEEYGVHTALRYLTACAELGLGRDARLDAAADAAMHFLEEKEGADLQHDYSGCSNALLLRALVMLGYHSDPRLRGLLARYAAGQVYDGGFLCRRLLEKNPARKSCYKAALAALLLFGECRLQGICPPQASGLLDYFLKRDVFYDSGEKSHLLLDGKPGWRVVDNFFPVETMRIGLVQVLAALAILGAGQHPALARGWALLEGKRNERGRFLLEGTLTRQPYKFGKLGEENPWITFYALQAEQYRRAPA